jgi:hypothetical protein
MHMKSNAISRDEFWRPHAWVNVIVRVRVSCERCAFRVFWVRASVHEFTNVRRIQRVVILTCIFDCTWLCRTSRPRCTSRRPPVTTAPSRFYWARVRQWPQRTLYVGIRANERGIYSVCRCG